MTVDGALGDESAELPSDPSSSPARRPASSGIIGGEPCDCSPELRRARLGDAVRFGPAFVQRLQDAGANVGSVTAAAPCALRVDVPPARRPL